jgi:2-amino-4-hydroxy-6-hydroxymethyldihydropteridine diphosphokinase
MGNREENLQKSIALLQTMGGEIIKVSSLYETEPWKMDDSASFINQVIILKTLLPAYALMDALLEIESKMGRIRPSVNNGLRQAQADKYESRIIDMDILFYNDTIISTTKVTIPHPLLHQRKFVLEPLAEISPGFIHPVLNKDISQLLLECTDAYTVAKIML